MDLFPEQQRALAYIRKRGTEASLDSIQERVAGTYAAFEALVESVPAAVAREHRATSGWSIQEVVDHLIVSDRPAIDQLGQLLAGRPVETPIPASLQSADPLGLSWAGLLEQFLQVHSGFLDVLDTATEGLPQTATAAVQMVVQCAGPDGALRPVKWVERLDWKAFAIVVHAHNRQHIAQVERILAAPPAPETSPSAPP